jgi:hypothetical protein
VFTRARLIRVGLVAAGLTAGALVAARLTLCVVGDHAARHELAGHHTGSGTIPD